ncbi:hypothetical protein [Burkholderia cenocepacia]|uniref:hypothetical protein n=1 Tax=Burkholderia cenocepacia TaxID=95486 RepID=UPI0039F0CD7B
MGHPIGPAGIGRSPRSPGSCAAKRALGSTPMHKSGCGPYDQIEVGPQAGQIRSDVDPACEAGLLIAARRGLRMQSVLDLHAGNIAQSIDSLKRGLPIGLLVAPSTARALPIMPRVCANHYLLEIYTANK